MTFTRQLWLTLAAPMILAIVVSLIMEVVTGRNYLEQEAHLKNNGNAELLALSLRQLGNNRKQLSRVLSTQFQSDNYQRIELRDERGQTLLLLTSQPPQKNVPGWFRSLVNLKVPPGSAVIHGNNGKMGMLLVESRLDYAYLALWRSTLLLLGWLGVAILISVLLGLRLIRAARRHMFRAAEQVQRLAAGQFISYRLPAFREFRTLVDNLNHLGARIEEMLAEERKQTRELQELLERDPVTGLPGRTAFLAELISHLESPDSRASGSVILVRVMCIEQVNEQLGREGTDMLLCDLTRTLTQFGKLHGDCTLGRTNGSDFILLIPGMHDLATLRDQLTHRLRQLAERSAARLTLPAAISAFAQGDRLSTLMATMDGALASAEIRSQHGLSYVEQTLERSLFSNHALWRNAIQDALNEGVYLAHYPVLKADQELLHYECPALLRLAQQWQNDKVSTPWVTRLGLNAQVDMAIVEAVLDDISKQSRDAAIRLSANSIREARFVLALTARLQSRRTAAQRLWIELPANLAVNDAELIIGLSRALQPLGVRLGLGHVGTEFNTLSTLSDLGITFVKINPALVQGISTSKLQQSLIHSISTVCRSIGVVVIARGVFDRNEARILHTIGVDAVTGPGIRFNNETTR